MLRLTEIKLPLDHSEDDLKAAILQRLGIGADDLLGYSIFLNIGGRPRFSLATKTIPLAHHPAAATV